MRLASFSRGGRSAFGAVRGDGIVDLSSPEVPTLRAALTTWGVEGLLDRAGTGRTVVSLQGMTWLQPIVDPDKIICVGLNYYDHAKEANLPVPERPSLFVRFASSQVGHLDNVVRPRASSQFDYEAELAVVIGRGGRHIAEARAHEHVLGYSCFAENSIRDWQMHSRQATPGKNFERSGAFGPWIVTPDEAGPVEAMDVIGRLNGREMQHDKAANMIFSIAQTIAYVSTFTTLLPGDVIVTGTPAGVGVARQPPGWLGAGDRFEVEITGGGVLAHTVVDETESRSN
jgi:2-keto-4-pentenoate hydratase/2-oxohepta-3-ene-1,7-dioic acid hydratase in catechol pathway